MIPQDVTENQRFPQTEVLTIHFAIQKTFKRENHRNILTGAETFFPSLHLSFFFYRDQSANFSHIVKYNIDNLKITPAFFFNSHESLLVHTTNHDHSKSSFMFPRTMVYFMYVLQETLLLNIHLSNILQTLQKRTWKPTRLGG